MDDDAKLDDLFHAGLRTAARPYERVAAAHRDEMLSPAPKSTLTTRVRDRSAGFASAHRRLFAGLTAAAALTGAAAYALPNVQSSSRAKVDAEASQTTISYPSQGTVPGRGTHPGAISPNNTPATGSNIVVPPAGYVGAGGNDATQPGGATGTATATGTQTGDGGSGTTGPSGPPDSTSAPQYNTANTVHAVLHDGNVLSISAQNQTGTLDQWVDEGAVEIGFQDARTQPASGVAQLWLPAVADAGRGVTLTPAVAISAGTTRVVHLVYVNNKYTLTARVGNAVVNGDTGFVVHVAAASDVNRNNPYLVKTALDADGFELGGVPALHQGDEPCWTNDSYTPADSDVWVGLALRPQQRPSLNIDNNVGGTWTLHIVGYNGQHGDLYPNGDLHQGKTAKFQLPPPSQAARYGKYVLQYTNGSSTRTIVIFRVAK